MEVHTHTHTERKKFTHYLWEFLMLFLAVFCGFLAENIREHQIERKKEKEYIRAMIEDLKEDTTSFTSLIKTNAKACAQIDTLISLLKEKDRDASAKRIYYMARLIPLNDANLICQNKTFEQLKSSGDLRLIHNFAIQNRVGAYYQINKFIETGPTPMQFQNRRDLILSFDKLFDAGMIQEIMKTFGDHSVNIPEDQFVLLSKDPSVINSFCTRYHFIYSTKKVVSEEVKRFIEQTTKLITYLQKGIQYNTNQIRGPLAAT
jgi:hypothetical protein